MRLRLGVAMPVKGGRTAIVGTEVRERRDAERRLVHDFTIGQVDRVAPFTVEAARDRITGMVKAVADLHPCVIIDVGSPQGMALRQALLGQWSSELHRPHAYPGTGARPILFSSFLQAYSQGRVHFEPNLAYRSDLDRALVFYMGGGVRQDGVELSSEDEALVVALGLSLFWPKHGPMARPFEESPAPG